MLREIVLVEASVEVEQTEPVVAPQRSILDYARPNIEGVTSSIVWPQITANNFELKPNSIQMVQQMPQFDEFQDEEPYAHLTNFMEICDTFKVNGVSEDAIHL